MYKNDYESLSNHFIKCLVEKKFNVFHNYKHEIKSF